MNELNPVEPRAPKHTWVDDIVGIATGTFLAAFGIVLMHLSHLVTGGTVGVALFLGYLTSLPFGVLYILISLPFLGLALWKKGANFTLRSLICVALVSVLEQIIETNLHITNLPPIFGAIAGNLIASVGILILFRHKSSLGGFNVLALLAQEKLGWSAGYTQMALDVVVVTTSLAIAPPMIVLFSAAGAVLLNFSLALNHKPGRYQGF